MVLVTMHKDASVLNTTRLVVIGLLALTFLLSVRATKADITNNPTRTAHFADLYLTAVSKDNAPAVKALLDQGMSPNQNDPFGDPLLFDAARTPAIKVLQLLIKAGANINVINTDGYPLIMTVVSEKNKPVFDILMAQKPDLTMENDSGHTALDFAIQVNKRDATATTTAILGILQDANAPRGDRQKSIRSKDGMLTAHATAFSVDANTGIATITGTVTNHGKQHYKFVEINAKFIDDVHQVSDVLIDTGMDNVQSLDPGETWKFKIVTLKEGATGYKFTDLSGHS